MDKHILFYFSGTGNCLKLAKDIAKALSNCELVAMGNKEKYFLEDTYSSIGFVYPTYFQGIPNKVRGFLHQLDFGGNQSAYVYAVASCGGMAGNAVSQVKEILNQKGVALDYGNSITMFSNYIVMYDMSSKVDEKTSKSDRAAISVIADIQNKRQRAVGKPNSFFEWYYTKIARTIPTMDKGYWVSENCVGCGICEKVCPVSNIALVDRKPAFQHHCEQCVACIQYCPKQAIQYKHITQNRGRYTNPYISHQELSDCNHKE